MPKSRASGPEARLVELNVPLDVFPAADEVQAAGGADRGSRADPVRRITSAFSLRISRAASPLSFLNFRSARADAVLDLLLRHTAAGGNQRGDDTASSIGWSSPM